MSFFQVHIKQECSLVVIACPNGCGEKIPKKDVSAGVVLLIDQTLVDSILKYYEDAGHIVIIIMVMIKLR